MHYSTDTLLYSVNFHHLLINSGQYPVAVHSLFATFKICANWRKQPGYRRQNQIAKYLTGSTTTCLRCGRISNGDCYIFTATSVGKRILKTG